MVDHLAASPVRIDVEDLFGMWVGVVLCSCMHGGLCNGLKGVAEAGRLAMGLLVERGGGDFGDGRLRRLLS